MQQIADYLDRGGPVVGFRTATHAFQIKRADAKFRRFDWQNKDEYPGGFGRQILGETWVSHYGTNHKQSSRLILEAGESAHPILRGVKDVHVQSGGYTANPIEGSHVLARGQILDGMTPDSPPAKDKEQMLRTSNRLAIAGTVFLALGMTGVVFLIGDILFKGLWAAVTSAVVAGSFAWFWYGLPLSRRPGGAARAR
jgi:hypothetical protein